MTEKKADVVKVGPPVDERVDDGRKHNHLHDPRPQGVKQGEQIEELESRQNFLRDVNAKVVEPAKQEKPKGSSGAQTK